MAGEQHATLHFFPNATLRREEQIVQTTGYYREKWNLFSYSIGQTGLTIVRRGEFRIPVSIFLSQPFCLDLSQRLSLSLSFSSSTAFSSFSPSSGKLEESFSSSSSSSSSFCIQRSPVWIAERIIPSLDIIETTPLLNNIRKPRIDTNRLKIVLIINHRSYLATRAYYTGPGGRLWINHRN